MGRPRGLFKVDLLKDVLMQTDASRYISFVYFVRSLPLEVKILRRTSKDWSDLTTNHPNNRAPGGTHQKQHRHQ